MPRLVRATRYAASLAVGLAHMLLALWAGVAAGTYAWQHGYTLPLDTSSSAAWNGALAIGLLVAMGALLWPQPWMTQVRYLVQGRPLAPCPTCGALGEPPAAHNDLNTTPKEITP
ncbi:hypothetical protein ACWD5V_39390 [Streptomyces sp. NPDC002523]